MRNLVYELTTPNIRCAYIINDHFYDSNQRVKHGRLVSRYYGEALEFIRPETNELYMKHTKEVEI